MYKKKNVVHDRIMALISSLGITVEEFEVNCGFGSGFVSRITRMVQKKSLMKIKARYPKVSMNWLVTGKGEMYSQDPENAPTIRDRLMQFINYKNISPREFERTVGIANGYMSKDFSRMRSGTMLKIKNAYPDLNAEWVLLGTGTMTSESSYTFDVKIKDRLRLFTTTIGVGESFFLMRCGIGLKRIEDMSDDMNVTTLSKIIQTYPILNKTWLLTGDGEMLVSEARQYPLLRRIPIVYQAAHAGYLAGYADLEYVSSLPTIPFSIEADEQNDRFIAFEVRGDSMDNDSADSYKDGDILICKELDMPLYKDSPLPFKRRDFVIVHKDGILVKRVIAHDISKHTITIHSISDSPEYHDMVIDLADVRQLFTVEYQQRKRRR